MAANRFSIEAVFRAVDKFTGPVRGMQTSIAKASGSMTRNLKRVTAVTSSLSSGLWVAAKAATALGTVAFGGVAAGAGLMLREFSKIEDATAGFQPILGTLGKAQVLMAALKDTASTTPFSFNVLADQAKQLLPVINGGTKEIIDTLRMMGDVAGGQTDKLQRITAGFTKAMLVGRPDMESLRMIGEAGVPIISQMQKSLDMTAVKFRKMLSAGRITNEDLIKTFRDMTGQGGMFFNAMDIASQTLTGRMSTFKDEVSRSAAAIGGAFAPAVKKLVIELTQVAIKVRLWAEANRDLLRAKFEEFVTQARRVVGNLIDRLRELNAERPIFDRVLDFFKALSSAFVFLQNHGATILKVAAWVVGLTVALNTLVTVLTVVNLLMAINPVGLLIIGITALVALIYSLVTNFEGTVAVLKGFFNMLGAGAMKGLDMFIEKLGSVRGVLMILTKPLEHVLRAFRGIINGGAKVMRLTAGLLGFSSEEDAASEDRDRSGTIPLPPTPQDRSFRFFNENNTTNRTEVTLRDETNRAQVTGGSLGNGFSLIQSGAF